MYHELIVIGIGICYLLTSVYIHFKHHFEKKESPTISRGLAISYFYGLWEYIREALGGTGIEVEFNASETRIPNPTPSAPTFKYRFDAADVRILIIMPEKLDPATISVTRNKIGPLRAAVLFLATVRGRKDIRYELDISGAKPILQIQDFTAPAETLSKYVENTPALQALRKKPRKWAKYELRLLTDFRKTLENLMSSLPIEKDKIEWVPKEWPPK